MSKARPVSLKVPIKINFAIAVYLLFGVTALSAEQRDLQDSDPVARSLCNSIESELIQKGVTSECFVDERSRVPGTATILVGVTASVDGREAGAVAALNATVYRVANADQVGGIPITQVLVTAGDPIKWTISVRAIKKCMELFDGVAAQESCFDRNLNRL